MRILQMAPYFIPYCGGQERYVYNLSKYLVRMGHEVHVATSNFPRSKELEVLDGIVVKRYKCLARPLNNPLAPGFFALRNEVKGFDMVNVHNEHSFAAMIATYLKKRLDVPMVLTEHGQLGFGNQFVDVIERAYSKTVARTIFRTVDHIVALSSSDAEYVFSFGIARNKVSVVPNAVDIDRLETHLDQDPSEFARKYGVEGKEIILFVGPVIRRKGVEYLLRAIPHVIKESYRKDVIFVIVGEGGFLEKAKYLARALNVGDHVLFTGEIAFDEMVQAYKLAVLFVLPSFSEGVPTSILEAVYFGLPIVATDIPGIRDYFGEVALLVPSKNERELAKAILSLLNDRSSREHSLKAGRELVRDNFSWEKVSKKYEDIAFRRAYQR